MSPVAEERVTDTRLNEIRYRLNNSLNEEGLRAWYPNDVSLLLREVMGHRRIIAEALNVARQNPALDQPTDDLIEAVTRIGEKWADIRKGVWARAETKRLRESLVDTEENLAQHTVIIAGQKAQISQLQAEIEELQGRIVDTIAEARRAGLEREKALTAKQTHIAQTDAEVTQLKAQLDNTVAAARRALAQQQADLAGRAARAESLLTQAIAALRD